MAYLTIEYCFEFSAKISYVLQFEGLKTNFFFIIRANLEIFCKCLDNLW